MLKVPSDLKLLYYRPELSHTPCRDVLPEDYPKLPLLIQKMSEFCLLNDGCGLSAPQVGISIRLAVVLADPKFPIILINPEIENFAGKDILDNEGCLSIPPIDEALARVWRSEIVTIKNGSLTDPYKKETKKYKDYEARIIQHEIDHINPKGNIFFIDRIGPIARQITLRHYTNFLRKQNLNELQLCEK